jgi:membrane protein implicated in regulation of membrane protease activity
MPEEDETPEAVLAAVYPPLNLLVLGAAAVALSAALLLLSGMAANVVGYLLASVVTISLVGTFHRTDLQRRQSPLYRSRRALGRWAGLIAALGVVVAALHTWAIATALAK